ncbi:MATE family efflux transporter [Bradyrhizobium sp. CB2312]|uniref:MATE family efflux transporter n=1 Tax=Bradyrhizobium sp. CB2312 TaxID=3039155 RepID=UPI0032C233B5
MRKTAEKTPASRPRRLAKWVAGRQLTDELSATATLATPIALTQLGQITMMATDLAWIGHIGTEAVAAAALAGMILSVGVTFAAGDLGGRSVRGPSMWCGGRSSGTAPSAHGAMDLQSFCGLRSWFYRCRASKLCLRSATNQPSRG